MTEIVSDDPRDSKLDRVLKDLPDLPELSKDELPANAWIVYTAIKEMGDDYRVPVSYNDGVKGYVQSVSIYHVCRTLWPRLAALGRADARVRKTHQLIVGYLIDTGNLVLIKRGSRLRRSEWWVPLAWQDRRPSDTFETNPEDISSEVVVEEPDDAADETVEERQEKPSREACPLCGQVCETQAGMVKHALASHVDLDGLLVAYMRKHKGEHVHVSVIREDMRKVTKLPLSNLCVSVHLRHLSNEPLTGINRTDTMGYYEFEPYHACREPGCDERFLYRQQLLEHEDGAHPNSTYRTFACDRCAGRFYNQRGLTTHQRQAHGDRPVTEAESKEIDVPPTTEAPQAVPTDLQALAQLIQDAQRDKAELAQLREGLGQVVDIVNHLADTLTAVLNHPGA